MTENKERLEPFHLHPLNPSIIQCNLSQICKPLFSADALKQAKIDEAICDAKEMKWGYFAMTKFFGKEPSEEGLKEVTDSMQALNDLRYKVRFTITYSS